jgi:hypothetical protein
LAGPQAVQRAIKMEDIPAWVFMKKGVDVALVRSTEEKAQLDEQTAQVAGAVAAQAAEEGGVGNAVQAVAGLSQVAQ